MREEKLICETEGIRLDRFVSEQLDLSRSRIQQLIDDGQIREEGSHEELMRLGGKYAELYRFGKSDVSM